MTMIEQRALRPPVNEDTPNTTVSTPATVGSPDPEPGDPVGVEVVGVDSGGPWPPSFLHASRWAGWPEEWWPPLFGNLEQLTDVAWWCIDKNSSIFAAMPPYLTNASPTLPDDWIVNPSPEHYTSWADFAKNLMWDFQSVGEVLVYATAYYATGWPARFFCLPPHLVNIELVDGEWVYRFGSTMLNNNDVLHIKYRTVHDQPHGQGPLEVGRMRLVAANVLLRYAVNFVQGGGVPSSVLEVEDEITSKQANDLREQWIIARMENLGLPAVAWGGAKWKATQVDPLSSAMVELSAYTEARVCAALGVPPHFMALPAHGASLTYTTAALEADSHWRQALRPLSQRLMMALSNWLVPRGTGVEVNRDEYIRPGPLERAQTNEILLRNGVITVEQWQRMERFDTASSGPTAGAEGVLK
jgi:HK97 family phage portal protein